jgi:hypothetical protein
VRLAEQLADAVVEPKKAERVRLAVGQYVEVETRDGSLVARGVIQMLNPETKSVRVVDSGSGTDLQIDVDPSRYNIWVRDFPVPGVAPMLSKQPEIDNVRGSTPGAFTLGKRFRILP